MSDAGAACDWLCTPEAEVSAHYLIAANGQLVQMVDEAARAWHAGAGAWGGVTDVNSHSIGIELDNTGSQPFSDPQMTSLEGLLSDLMVRWAIPPERVIGHSDMAPGRKIDPGRRFDWRRLAMGGLSVWPGPGGDPEADFAAMAQRFGYPDAPPQTVLDSFRQRFRPGAQGAISAQDRALISDLARRFPVDASRHSA